jgi:hypothetical protein
MRQTQGEWTKMLSTAIRQQTVCDLLQDTCASDSVSGGRMHVAYLCKVTPSCYRTHVGTVCKVSPSCYRMYMYKLVLKYLGVADILIWLMSCRGLQVHRNLLKLFPHKVVAQCSDTSKMCPRGTYSNMKLGTAICGWFCMSFFSHFKRIL